MSTKKGRPPGTTRRPKAPPPSLEGAIVRAIFPAGFPVNIGWMLYEIRRTRSMVSKIKRGEIVLPDLVVMEGMHPDGKEVSRITMLDSMRQHRDDLEQKFELECTVAVLHGRSEFFDHVARGVAALESFPKVKLAVADAWHFLTRYCQKNPSPGEVANHANDHIDERVTASQARDYLRSMGMIGGN